MNLFLCLLLTGIISLEGYTPFRSYRIHKLYESGDTAGARALADEAIADNPLDWRALYNAAVIAVGEKHLDEALQHLEKALELQPTEACIKKMLDELQALKKQQQKQEEEKQQQQKDSEGSQRDEPPESSADASKKSEQSADQQQNSSEQSSSQKNDRTKEGAHSSQHDKDSRASEQERAENGKESQNRDLQGAQGDKEGAHNKERAQGGDASEKDVADKKAAQKKLSDELQDALEKSMSQGERYLMRLVEGNDQALQKHLLQRALMQGEQQGGGHDW